MSLPCNPLGDKCKEAEEPVTTNDESSQPRPGRLPDSGIVFAVVSAVLFGAASPFAKLLLAGGGPVVVAGLLYLGSGAGLGAWWLFRRIRHGRTVGETPLARKDLRWLAAAIVLGGVAGPALQMIGLSLTPASTASLLLNIEGVLTALIAWTLFRENFDRRIALGMALIVAGSTVLTWAGRPEAGVPWGPLAIAGACLCWALDNNLTRKVSGGDPIQVAALKGVCAGAFNLSLGLATHGKLPSAAGIAGCAVVGFFGYGLSLMFFVLALRRLGTARTGAYFSVAPFVGAGASIVFLRDVPTLGFGVAFALMAAGIWLHLSERHEHEHVHEAMEHSHRHSHDEHHMHEHATGDPPGEPHAHLHVHQPLRHTHRHYPDLHHGHRH